MKLSDYVWEYIADIGTRHVFMFPGGGAMHLVDSLGKSKRLEYIPMFHEQACAMAAETYSRMDDGLGVALVTTGPGGTNTITGVAAAWLESTPMLIISGQVKTADLKDGTGVRQRGNQEIGIVDIVKTITKYAVTVKDANKIKYYLDYAVYMAKEGRPGPVWLDIPLDIQSAMIEPEQLEGFQAPEKEVLKDEAVQKVFDLLLAAERPVIIAGQGIERNHGTEVFRKMVNALRIPVLTSWMAKELLEYDNPYNFGMPGMVAPRYSNKILYHSDLVLAIGTRLDSAMIGYNVEDFAPEGRHIIVDIDEAEIDKFKFTVDCKIVSDATAFIENLLNNISRMESKEYPVWMKQCNEWKEKYPIILPEFREEKDFVNPYHFFDKLSEHLSDDEVIIPGSSGACIDVYWLCIKNRAKQRTLSTGALGSMGYGIPAAIGACISAGRRVVSIEGDGSLQLNIQELATIKGRNLPIKIFINNNGGYLSIMNMQRTHFQADFVGANTDSQLYIPDYMAIAAAYGLQTFVIRNHDEIDRVVEEVLNSEGPAICCVCMKNDQQIQPKVMSRVTENGTMKSGSINDMWPFVEEE